MKKVFDVRAARHATVVAMSIFMFASDATAGEAGRGPASDAELRGTIVRSLSIYITSTRLRGEKMLRRVEKYPYLNRVYLRSTQDARLDGVAFAYMNLVGNLTRTKFVLNPASTLGRGFLFVFDDSLNSWSDLKNITMQSPGAEFFESAFDVAEKQKRELHDCEYVPIYQDDHIAGGIVYYRPARGVASAMVCLYRAIFGLAGLQTVGSDEKTEPNPLLDAKIIEALYSSDLNRSDVDTIVDDVLARIR